jgi:hypothetical protein
MVTFLASLPDIQSGVKINPQEGSARLQLEIPATELAKTLQLVAMAKGKVLRFTVEVAE